MKVLHAVTSEGRVVRGVEVIRRIYAAVGLGWLFAVTGFPVIGPIIDKLYNIWAHYRTNITRQEALDVLISRHKQLRNINDVVCKPCSTVSK